MSWKEQFSKGVASYRSGNYTESITHFNKALETAGDSQCVVLDSRAATYEKLGSLKEGLNDAKKAIKLSPKRWQGYARAARLLSAASKYEEALKSVSIAIQRVNPDDVKRKVELETLRSEITHSLKRYGNHFGRLPLEVCGEIFQLVMASDRKQLSTLNRVSRQWNSIVWKTPSLWDVLSLGNKRSSWKAKRWIERSRGNIRELIVTRNLDEICDWSNKHLFGLQWENLDCCRICNWDIYRNLQDEGHGSSLLRLREVHIIGGEFGSLDFKHWIVNHPHADFLQCVNVSGASFPLEALTTRQTSLTELVLDKPLINISSGGGTALKWLLDVFTANRSLRTVRMRLHSLSSDFTVQTSLDTVSLPKLEHLEMGNGVDPSVLMQYLDTPNLGCLRIFHSFKAIDAALTRIVEGRYSCLTELSIDMSVISSVDVLVECLRTSSKLETLSFGSLGNITMPVLETLASSQGDDIVCPLLRSIDVSNCADVKVGPIVKLVKSRTSISQDAEGPATADGEAEKVVRIKSIRMDGCPQVESEALPWLRQNVKYVSCVYMTKRAASYKR